MNSFKQAFRRMIKKGEHSTSRIVSLAAGLAFGVLLLSEVLYLRSFDSFYPNADRIYVVCDNIKRDNAAEMKTYRQVSGAIAPGLKSEVPGIEEATRMNSIGASLFYAEDLKTYRAEFSLADEHLFDILPRPVISGNPGEILRTPMNCMVSDKIAEEMGGNVIGKVIELKEYPNKKVTIAGVFKSLPENTNYKYDVLISMVSTPQFTWDGTQNWLGNDRYYACVRLAPGVSPESLNPAVRKMREKHQDISALEKSQKVELFYSFEPVTQVSTEYARNMIVILSLIAFAVLFASLLNYTLLTLSALANRGKMSAIHKCCGAQPGQLQKMIFSETLIVFLISLVGAFLIILVLRPLVEAQVGHSLLSALNLRVVLPILGLLAAVVLSIGYLPGRVFSQIPVATAFRSYRQKQNKWKLGLLSMQFVGTSFIVTMLVVIMLQYSKMIHADHGYKANDVFYCTTSGIDGQKITRVMNELKALPEVEMVGLGFGLPTDGASGNNIFSPDGKKELFNIADFYFVDDNYLPILGIPVTEGQPFSSEGSAVNNVMISQKAADLLAINNGWKDGVAGKQISVSEHGSTTVQGVFPDFVIQSIASPDPRPAVFFYLPAEKFAERRTEKSSFAFNILIKANKGARSGFVGKVAGIINSAMPHPDAVVSNLADVQQASYSREKGFRNSMMAGNAIIILITVIGLIGYTASEVTRRRKELAIRRISGAHFSDILSKFIFDLGYIALPTVALGLALAWFAAGRWMQNFAAKIDLGWSLFTCCSLAILAMIAITALVNYARTANQNPVEALRCE
jgi:putative ABC transport system permease protein